MSKTIQNLITAYLGESQARNRYTFYASAAKKEGYEQIAEIMTTTADQEKKHGKTFYEFLVKLNNLEIPQSGKGGVSPTTIELQMEMEIEVVL
jgi:rubrerythrin